ncbi:MAG: nucleoside hydrolase [Chloroflexota bacterium]
MGRAEGRGGRGRQGLRGSRRSRAALTIAALAALVASVVAATPGWASGAVGAVGASVASGAAGTSYGPRTAQLDTRPLIVDTDLGPDDLLALAWLVSRPELDIRAITVTGTGRATCAVGVRNLRALLAALDATGPAVGCGPETPSKEGTPFPSDQRAAADGLYGLQLPPAPDAGAAIPDAAQVIGSVLDAATDPISILALGPWTTLGKVLKDPDRAVRVASLTASLGAIETPGDVLLPGSDTPSPMEWNAHADPGAVQRVFDSGVPIFLVPTDAAAQIGMSQTLRDGLAGGGDGAAAQLVAQLFAADPATFATGFAPRDALAAVSLVDPTVMETLERLLTVEARGPDAGTLTESADGMPAQVALTADRNVFELDLLDGIRGEVSGTQAPGGLVTITGGADACSLDGGGTTQPGSVDIQGVSTDEPMVAILADITSAHTTDDLRKALQTADPTNDPPDWLFLAAYLEIDAGGSDSQTVDLTPGNYAAICVTGEASTPRYLVADELLPIGG